MKSNDAVKIDEYNPEWPEIFKKESRAIHNALLSATKIFEIHHVGSTAIPNMPAKPIIDILLEYDNIDDIVEIEKKLVALNYSNFRRNVVKHYSFFSRKQDGLLIFHLHVFGRGDPQIKRHVNFRDYLIHHEHDAKEYFQIKSELAKKFTHNRDAYTSGKSKVIQTIDRKAKVWEGRRKNFLPPNTELEVQNASQEKIFNAIEANSIVQKTYFEQYLPTLEFFREPKYTRVLNANLKDDTFNYIIDSDFPEQDANSIVADAKKLFNEHALPFCWVVSDTDKPKNLSEFLKNNGLSNTENNIGMYLDLDSWNSDSSHLDNFEILRVHDARGFKDLAYVLSTVLTSDEKNLNQHFSEISKLTTPDDSLEYYVGYLNGAPIVCGMICFFGHVAGLHYLVTTPNFRQKGYGTAMQKFRLKRAKDCGFHMAILLASEGSYSLYSKLGWQTLGLFQEFKNHAGN